MLNTGCGGDRVETGSPEEALLRIKEKGNSNSVLQFYTAETVALLKKYMGLTGMRSETSVDILSFIPEGAEYRITGKKSEKDSCSLTITFVKHPSENAAGQSVGIKMVKENNNWKIDRKDDLKRLIDAYEKRGVEGYLKKIR